MTDRELWRRFSRETGIDEPYQAWAFGDDPDRLAALVLAGKKTATASSYPIYALKKEPLPQVGEYSVVLNTRREAVCIVRTTRVYTVPFQDVSPEQAYKEGEGDRSLAYWREVHRAFFTREMTEAGLSFTEDMPVVCEEFEVVYRP